MARKALSELVDGDVVIDRQGRPALWRVRYGSGHWSGGSPQRDDDGLYHVEGQATRVRIFGLKAPYGPAYFFRGELLIGCQRINASKAFRALAKVLGYEVTG